MPEKIHEPSFLPSCSPFDRVGKANVLAQKQMAKVMNHITEITKTQND
jgi:hypothetical protein